MRKAALTTLVLLQVTLLVGCSGESTDNMLRRMYSEGCKQVSSAPTGVIVSEGRFGTRPEMAIRYECPAHSVVVFR